jgi:hypothetical protein
MGGEKIKARSERPQGREPEGSSNGCNDGEEEIGGHGLGEEGGAELADEYRKVLYCVIDVVGHIGIVFVGEDLLDFRDNIGEEVHGGKLVVFECVTDFIREGRVGDCHG